MSHITILVFSILFTFAYLQDCTIYTCASELVANEPAYCANYSYNGEYGNYTLTSTCPETNEVCPYMNAMPNNGAICQESKSKLLPGYSANDASQCQTGILEGDYCGGPKKGNSCVNGLCDVNLYCSDDVCVEAGNEGDDCDSDTPCKSYLLCNKDVCTSWGSVSSGEKTDHSEVCQTDYTTTSFFTTVCATGAPTFTKISSDNETCFYSDDSTQSSTCGYMDVPYKFCVPGMGDKLMIDSFDALVKYLKAEPDCPIPELDHGIEIICDRGRDVGEDLYKKAIFGYYQLYYYNEIYNTSDCLKNWYNKAYWIYADPDVVSFSTKTTVGISAFIIAIFAQLF